MRWKTSRWTWAAAGLLLLCLLAWAALRGASALLQSRIVAALGPHASIGAIDWGWSGVDLYDLRITSAGGSRAWPAADELRAAKVHVRPDLRTLWTSRGRGAWHIAQVTVQDGYLSMLRTREGQLKLLPSLLEGKVAPPPGPAGSPAPAPTEPTLVIHQIRLDHAAIDFYDASLKTPAPHRMQLEDIDVSAGPFALPGLNQALEIDAEGTLKGVQHDGHVALRGKLTPSTRDARLQANFKGIDMIALQPYLLKLSEDGIKRGQLDLTIDASVEKMQLHAPGEITLTGLELNSSGGVLGSFAGVPRQAVLAAMSRDGRIQVKFTLDGRLDDPAFSLNESLATRIASGLAEALGVSVRGVVEGVGNLVKGLFGR